MVNKLSLLFFITLIILKEYSNAYPAIDNDDDDSEENIGQQLNELFEENDADKRGNVYINGGQQRPDGLPLPPVQNPYYNQNGYLYNGQQRPINVVVPPFQNPYYNGYMPPLMPYKLCTTHSMCPITEYCQVSIERKEVRGYCARRNVDGEYCTENAACFSKHCHWSKCKGGPKINNVEKGQRCEKTTDCHHEQYCHRKKCVNRSVKGWCSDDDHCLSGHCSMLRCEPVFNTPSENNLNQNIGK